MRPRHLLLVAALALAALPARAEVEIIQVGGGDRIEDAQGQIEANVLWLSRVLPKVSRRLTNYYAAGTSAEKDVAYLADDAPPSDMEPLARVFGSPRDTRIVYRHNMLGRVDGPTTKAALTEALGRKMAQVAPGGEVFLIYNGHGGLSWPDARHNYLRLWGEERMTVAEVDALLDRAPADATIRFIFPQCYSGAFHRLIYETPTSDQPGRQTRCGFLAQSQWDESEGCSLNVSKETFRDYTTYYFAPLHGRTRLDQPLASNPDLDGDGKLSYREGHLYMLRYAESKDLSRATSEAFLEDWEPWYLRWDTVTENRDSLYWELAEAVAERIGLRADDIAARRTALQQAFDTVEAERAALKDKVKSAQRRIQDRVTRRWPELAFPYTDAYRRLLEAELPAIAAVIAADPGYAELHADQNRQIALETEQLEAERRLAQVRKILRFKKLARLEAHFHRFASSDDRKTLERLLACENGELAPMGP